ncbi:MAG: hypothetical protein WBA66_04725 [Xanthobacteraceae bacterium]
MAVLNLTEARIRGLELGSGIWRDEQVKGLMVICHNTTKTYAVQGDVRRNGRHVRTVRVKIDRVDRIGLREARRRAREIMSTIQSGVDPTARQGDTGITLAQALEALPGNVQLVPDLRFVIGLDLYLVKPMQVRHWLRATALADAEQIAAELSAAMARQSNKDAQDARG